MNKSVIKFLSALAVVAAANPAAAVVLDIANPSGGFGVFGDVPSSVNFNWDANMKYEGGGYSARDAFICDPQNAGGACTFTILPESPATSVTLNSLRFGVYQSAQSIAWSVTDLLSPSTPALSGSATADNLNSDLELINLTSTAGFTVSFGPNSYLGGLLEVTYNEAVPAPASLALLGSALFGFVATRRKKA